MQRRQVLRAGLALSAPAIAGCNSPSDTPSASGPPESPSADSPSLRWERPVESSPVEPPLVAGNAVVHVGEQPGDEPFPLRNSVTTFWGFAAEDGSQSWSLAAGDDAAETWAYRDTLLSSANSGTVALAPDGTEQWRRPGWSVHALFGDERLFLDTDVGVVAVDLADGTELWTTLGAEGLVPAAIGDGVLYARGFANGGHLRRGLHAVSTADGTLRWSTSVGPRDNHTVLHADDTLVVGGYPRPISVDAGAQYPDRPTVEGVAADSGAVRWAFTPDADLALPRRAAAGAVLLKTWTYVQPNGGPDVRNSTLYALDLADGTERWHVEETATRTPLGQERFESASVATEVVGAGAAHVRRTDGSVTAHDLADGRERWRFDPHAASRESDVPVADHQPDLAFDGGDLLVTYADRLAALDPETGRRRWEYAVGEPLSQYWTVTDDAVVLTTETALAVVERV